MIELLCIVFGLTRKFIVVINQVGVDHYNLSTPLVRAGITSNPKCKCNFEGDEPCLVM